MNWAARGALPTVAVGSPSLYQVLLEFGVFLCTAYAVAAPRRRAAPSRLVLSLSVHAWLCAPAVMRVWCVRDGGDARDLVGAIRIVRVTFSHATWTPTPCAAGPCTRAT